MLYGQAPGALVTQQSRSLPSSPESRKKAPSTVRDIALAFSTEARAVQEFLAHEPVETPWPSQVTGEAFMANRANGLGEPYHIRGGLICDGMRMGKTRMIWLHIFRQLQQRVAQGRSRFGSPFLILCPKDVLHVWRTELDALLGPNVLAIECVDTGSLTAAQVGSAHLGRLVDRLRQQTDVIVSTYSTLAMTKSGVADLLTRELAYASVICDEGDILRNESTLEYKAVHSLKATSKWYVTGTPIHNNTGSLRAALRLIGLSEPLLQKLQTDSMTLAHFAQQLTLRRVRSTENHVELTYSDNMAEAVLRLRPIPVTLLDFGSGIEQRTYQHLVITQLKQQPHRPSQQPDFSEDRADDDETTGDVFDTVGLSTHVSFKQSLAVVNVLQQFCLSPQLLYDSFTSDALSAPPHVLLAPVTQMRELARFVPDFKEEPEDTDAMAGVTLSDPDDAYREWIVRLAVHEATLSAIGANPALVMQSLEPQEHDATRAVIDHVSAFLLPPVGTKERWICKTLLTENLDRTGEKVVIFSKWLAPLEKLAHLLRLRQALRIPGARDFTLLHGKVSIDERERERHRFMTDPRCGVMLSTLRTNTVGVDLTCANHVVLCDPSWNPMNEFQATSRVLGPKQTLPVHFYRLVLNNTIDAIVATRADSKVALDGLLPMSLQDELRDMEQTLLETKRKAGI